MSRQRITVPVAKLLKFSSKSPSWSCNILSSLSVRISLGHAPFTRMLSIVWLSARHPSIWTTAPQTAQRATKPDSWLRPTAKSYSRAQSCQNESKGYSQGCGFVIRTVCRGEAGRHVESTVLRPSGSGLGGGCCGAVRCERGDPRQGAMGGDRRSSHIAS